MSSQNADMSEQIKIWYHTFPVKEENLFPALITCISQPR